MSIYRQRLTTLDKAGLGDDDKTLAEVGVKEGDVVHIKDLGPQICKPSWGQRAAETCTDTACVVFYSVADCGMFPRSPRVLTFPPEITAD